MCQSEQSYNNKPNFFTRDVNKLEDLAKEKFKRRYCASVNNATAGLFLSYEYFQTKNFALTLW